MPDVELNPTQIKQLADLLNEQRLHLIQQLEHTETNSQPVTLDQQSVGRVSRIDAIQQQQMAKANRHQDTEILKAINASLTRLENAEYGYCLECGEPVGFARLQVQPHASLCLTCQSSLESR